jgi:hypothetical protein
LLCCPNLQANKLLFSPEFFVALQPFKAGLTIGFSKGNRSFMSGYGFRFLLPSFSLGPTLFFSPLLFFTVDFLLYPTPDFLFVRRRSQTATRPN